MPKTKISEFSATPANNTDIDSINIAEGCAPSGINDAIRELMAQLKDFQTGAVGDSFNGPIGASTASTGAFTTLSASSTVSGTGFSTYLASPPAIGGTAAAAVSATTLAASGAVTLSGGTANGVTYLNGSKVLTSGSALQFDGSRFFVGTTAVTTSSSQSGEVYSTGSAGFMFTNTTAANYALSVKNEGTSGTRNLINFYEGTGGGSARANISLDGSANFAITASTSLVFSPSSAEGMRLTSTGLGIGTSSPNFKLEVNSGATATTAQLKTTAATAYSGGSFFAGSNLTIRTGANATGNGSGIRFASDNNGLLEGMFGWVQNASAYGDFVWQGYNGSYVERMRLDSSGNLGIGTSSPSARLGVQGPQGGELYINYNGTSTNYYNGGTHIFQAASGLSERARIDSSGNLLVGSTSVIQGGTICSLYDGQTRNGIVLQTTFTSAGTTFIRFVNSAGTAQGAIDANSTTTVAYSTSSDYRLKNTIAPMTGALAKVAQLNPVTYKWNVDNSDGEGFIAHELAEICPYAVVGEKDAVDADGKIKPQGIDTSFLVATLTAAIQEQQALILSLKARLDAANL